MFIRSERLFLRPGWPEDWEELLTGLGDEAAVKNLAKAPWPHVSDETRWFADKPKDPRCPHFFVTVPTSSAPAKIIGSIGLGRNGGDVEIGYWIARDYSGRGYATEAVRAVARLAGTLGHRRISGSYFTENPASGRVLQKNGFKPTGEVRPRFSLTRGGDVPAMIHTLSLETPCNCDGSDDCGDAMRVA